jgi:hypothetical protein
MYSVIHFVKNPETAMTEIPALLRGDKTVSSQSELGTKNYELGVGAVILGAGYDDQAVKQLREAAGRVSSVPWLRPDTTKPTPPLGPAYGQVLVDRIKEAVKDLQGKGGMDKDAVVWY